MPTKVFTVSDDPCPFGKGVKVDSRECRSCEHYYRVVTATFFWCSLSEPEKQQAKPVARRRGRKAGNGKKKPVRSKTKTK